MTENEANEVFEDAYDLYQEIRDERGLDLRGDDGNGRDDILYKKLCKSIGCQEEGLAKYLKKEDREAEWLLQEFLQISQPFARMFEDIWNLLSSEQAPNATEDLRLRFGSEENGYTEVDLEEFREWTEVARLVSMNANIVNWTEETVRHLFNLTEIIHVDCRRGTDYRRGEEYELPPIETHRGDDFENYIRLIRNLFQYQIYRNAEVDESDSDLSVDDISNTDTPPLNLSDLLPAWEPIFDAHHTVPEDDRREAVEYFQKNIEPEIETASISVSQTQQSPLDTLRLPFWKHRWHTYEIWMTVQTLKALKNCDPQVRSNEGRIPVDGGDEAIVADLERVATDGAYVVSELRTSHDTDDREAIQPDLSICQTQGLDEEDQQVSVEDLDKNSRSVVIEYKQRKSLKRSHAEDRSQLYLDASPEATGLLMVNYSETPDVDLPEDATLIGNVRPGTEELTEYREEVQEYVGEAGLSTPFEDWTVLVDVSGSVGSDYECQGVKDALLEMLSWNGLGDSVYEFDKGLTHNPRISSDDVRDGLQTGGGTNLQSAIEELDDKYGQHENLLVISDGGHSCRDPGRGDSIEYDPKDLPSVLDNLKETLRSSGP